MLSAPNPAWRSNPVLCQQCGHRTRVYCTVHPKRYRECLTCKAKSVTVEVIATDVDLLMDLADSVRETVMELADVARVAG